MDVVEEIKQRLEVEGVVGRYLQLKKSGRNFKALCPFHHEKTPSFIVSPEKQIWHCFGCGEGGDVFEFVQKMDGVEFREALEKLARQAGIPESELNQGDSGRRQQKKRLYQALKLATKYYQQGLVENEKAQKYAIQERGLNKSTLETFRIGYAPNTQQGLAKFLKKHGFGQQEITKAGLARSRNGKLVDMFRGRLVIPLCDRSNRPVGFTGRVLDDSLPKYINTPSTYLFDKSRFIFGWPQAKDEIRNQKEALVVEGNMDVIMLHQAGIKNVVATSGTAVTRPQLTAINRLADRVKIAFDADAAGLKATKRAIRRAQGLELELSVVEIPEGKDPDDLAQEDFQLLEQIIEQATYSLDWLLEAIVAAHQPETATGKKAITNEYLKVLADLDDPVEQEHYLKQLGEVIDVTTAALQRKLDKKDYSKSDSQAKAAYRSQKQAKSEADTVQEAFLALNLAYPNVRASLDDAKEEYFTTKPRQQIFSWLKDHSDLGVDVENMPEGLQEQTDYVKILIVQAEAKYQEWSANDRTIETFNLAQRLEQINYKAKKQQLSNQIKKAERQGNVERANQLLAEFDKLVNQSN